MEKGSKRLKSGVYLKPIPGFPGYFAGTDGEIYSYLNIERDRHPKKLKKMLMSSKRYYFVSLRRDNNTYQVGVHRLVCMAFSGMSGGGMDSSHLDGNSLNNKPSNLIFEDRASNHRRKIVHGTHDSGSNNSRASFNKKDIVRIRRLRLLGLSYQAIANELGAKHWNVARVLRKETYKED